ncbi:MAG TPA: VOC family protein [Arsenicitalea sp.]|jgi:PhnB protein|nr:VOC family protein [Arsenicitalea sp.]
MASRLNPYLSFKSNAREAMEFYRSVFGGDLKISSFGEGGMSGDPAEADLVMHALLDTPSNFTLMASDTPAKMGNASPNGSISISGDDEAELRGYWDKLTQGGTVTLPLEKAPWGDVFGMLQDRFGVSWMVNIAGARS